jgi:nicotinamide-nucleotide amidase
MHAEIISVGTELLMGQIVNTNAQYISQKLLETGIGTYFQSVVGDNPERLRNALTQAIRRSDIVITTGGLGPTSDDITKEIAAEVMNKKLVIDKETFERIEAYFQKSNRKMSENNIKQAYLPEGCIAIRNRNGTAPGCIMENEGKVMILLPGPPKEMQPMFEDCVMPYFAGRMEHMLESVYIRIFGIGESSMEESIIDIIQQQDNPTIAPYAKEGEVILRVTARCRKQEDPYRLINPIVEKITQRLGDYVYSIENKNMEQVVAELLLGNNITLSVAESCTGGLISKKLTDIAGISNVFIGGITAYSNKMKMDFLGVSGETLARFGAVSSEVAREMARGIRTRTGSDIGLSVTGIAGPGGGTAEKPVGLVYIGISDKDAEFSNELRLWGDRDRIRNLASLHAMNLVRKHILGRRPKMREDAS